jgi:Na+/H+-dicarboxylate symporter
VIAPRPRKAPIALLSPVDLRSVARDKGATTAPESVMSRTFTYFVIAGMVLGVAVGWACNQFLDAPTAKMVAGNLSLVTDIFLRLIKMIIAPLVFTTLVAGIAHMEDAAAVGRIGAKTMAWFISASIVSLTVGLFMVHLLQPGAACRCRRPKWRPSPPASTFRPSR